MPHQPTALACTTIAARAEHADEVERFICDGERRDALVDGGPAIRAVDRLDGIVGDLLVLHGWRTCSHLESYRASSRRIIGVRLADVGTAVEPSTGEMIAQCSWLHG